MQLFRVDLERPGVLVPLTEPAPNYYIHGGALHPNGRWLFYGANVNERGEEIEASWIYRHDLATGERRVLARPEQPGWGAPLLNEQGTHILYQRQDLAPRRLQIWMVDIEGRRRPRGAECGRCGQGAGHPGCPMAGARWCWPRPAITGAWACGIARPARCAG